MDVDATNWDTGAVGRVRHWRVGRLSLLQWWRWQGWPSALEDDCLSAVRWGFWMLAWWSGEL